MHVWKKLAWYAGIAAVILLIVGGVLLLAANLYVQSQDAQQRIRQTLSTTLKMPVELTKTTITPWEGLRIDGITIRPEAPEGGAPSADFLRAESFRVRFAFWPLFQRQLIVRQVLLDRPQLAWSQNSRGQWRFPPEEEAVPLPTNETPPADVPPPTASAESSGSPALSPAPPSTPSKEKSDSSPAEKPPTGFSVAVDKFKLRHGNLEFLDKNARLIGRFEEVNLDGRITALRQASGTLWFDKAVLPSARLELTKFHSRWDFDEAAGLNLVDGRGELGGGTVTVNYRLSTSEDGSPFTARAHIDGVALEQLMPSGEGGALLTSGRLNGIITAQGRSGDAASRSGAAELNVVDAQLKDLPMLQMLGEMLRIDDLSHPRIKKGRFMGRLEGEYVYVEPLELTSANLQIVARGRYHMTADQLDIQARLVIDKAVSRQLPQFIEGNFTASGDEAPGSRYLDFTITGPLGDPKTDLRKRLMAGPANTLFDIIRPSSKPKNASKKPKRNAAAPGDAKSDGAPASTPAPTP